MKTCNNCKETKEDDSFYTHACSFSYKTWKSNDCKKCKNKMDHERDLSKQLAAGANNIVNCSGCDRLMKKKANRDTCFECNRKEINDGRHI